MNKENIRDYFVNAVTAATFVVFLFLIVSLMTGNIPKSGLVFAVPEICGFGLHFTLDGFRALYGTIISFMWMMSTLFSREYFTHYRNKNRYYLFLLVTLGATLGVFLSADFYTVFIFFEIMSLASYVWVVQDEKKESMKAGATYLAVAMIGGLVMLMGIFLLYNAMGTLMFDELITGMDSQTAKKLWPAGLCLFFGFGAKAGVFPLHIWLPKAHPVAPAPASALLSGVLTKAGIYGILVLSGYVFMEDALWGSMMLFLGVCTMAIGAVLALFSIDLKRTLACSSVSQIGFILVGIGMWGLFGGESALPARGALLHMINHSLIKLTLFMAAGVVFMNVHKLDLNEIKGFGRKKPLLNYIFLMGALGISGIPLWNGYISKTLLHESITEYMELMGAGVGSYSPSLMKGVEWIFLLSGGITTAYMTKLYIALFVEKNDDDTVQEKYDSLGKKYMNRISGVVLTVSASLLPIMGFFPHIIMDKLADMGQVFLHMEEMEQIAYFSLVNLKGALVSLGSGVLIYLIVVRWWMVRRENGKTVYLNRWNPYIDLENTIYVPVLFKFLPFELGVICRILDSFADAVIVLLRKTIYKDSKIPHELEEGNGITYLLGSIANAFERAANATILKKKNRNVDYRHKYALIYEELEEDRFIISRSMSFGLLMFCVGLIITVVYLLLTK